MNVKDDSVNIWGLELPMRKVLKNAEDIWREFGQSEVTITSARDGIHSAGSLHYYGLAVDLRVWGLTDSERTRAAAHLRGALGTDYDVIDHTTHIHVEYDPK